MCPIANQGVCHAVYGLQEGQKILMKMHAVKWERKTFWCHGING